MPDENPPSLPPEVLAARPNPLLESVQAEALRTGGNIHDVANRLAVDETATEELPAWLAEEGRIKQAAKQAIADADAATSRKLASYRAYCGAFDTLKILRDRLAYARALRAAWQSTLKNASAEFQRGLLNGIVATRDCLIEFALAREGMKVVPPAVEALTKQVEKAEAEIAEMQKNYGFTPPTAAPTLPATEPQGEQPEKKTFPAFRSPE